MEYIWQIIGRKQVGQDCTPEESAEIKHTLRKIYKHFPIESAEVEEEDNQEADFNSAEYYRGKLKAMTEQKELYRESFYKLKDSIKELSGSFNSVCSKYNI